MYVCMYCAGTHARTHGPLLQNMYVYVLGTPYLQPGKTARKRQHKIIRRKTMLAFPEQQNIIIIIVFIIIIAVVGIKFQST